jgi:hypothetical protein
MSKEIRFTGKLNGKGDQAGTLSVLEDGALVYEDVVNLSKAPVRTKLINLLEDKYEIEGVEQKLL